MEIISVIVAIIGGITGAISAYISWQQWKKIQKKIAMVQDTGKISEVLPAWYTSRMSEDHWPFGLLTISGNILAINNISAISDDGKWLDVNMLQKNDISINEEELGFSLIFAPTERTKMSVQIKNIVSAFELTTS